MDLRSFRRALRSGSPRSQPCFLSPCPSVPVPQKQAEPRAPLLNTLAPIQPGSTWAWEAPGPAASRRRGTLPGIHSKRACIPGPMAEQDDYQWSWN